MALSFAGSSGMGGMTPRGTPRTTIVPGVMPPSAPAPAPAPTTGGGAPGGDWFETAYQQQNRIGEQDRTAETGYSGDQWEIWKNEERQRIAAGTSANKGGNCPENKPFTSRPGPNGEVECAFKPDDCPEGSHVEGAGDNARCVGGDSAGGAPGGGGGYVGGRGPGGAGGGYGLTPSEQEYLGAMTSLANTLTQQSQRLFGAGMPAFLQSLDYYRKSSGAYGRAGVDTALAPQKEQIAGAYKGAEAKVAGLRGAEKAQAMKDLALGSAGEQAGVAQAQLPAAVQGLQAAGTAGLQMGLASEAQAAGIYAGGAEHVQRGDLTREGYATNITTANIGANAQLGSARISASAMRDVAALNANVSYYQIEQQRQQASDELAQQNDQFGRQLQLGYSELDANVRQAQADRNSRSSSALAGGLITGGIALL